MSAHPFRRRRALGWGALPLGSVLLAAVAYVPGALSAPPAALPAHAYHAPARVAASSVTPAQMADGPAIDIQNFQFAQPTLTVAVGTTITWTNRDLDEHTVTSKDRIFSSKGLDPGESFAYRFDAASTYEYFCALHPYMNGRIIVQ